MSVYIPDLDRQPELKSCEDLIELLLTRAGFSTDSRWEAHLVEKVPCNNDAQPIQCRHVVETTMALRITCKSSIGAPYLFRLNLYIPAALTAEDPIHAKQEVLQKLQSVEKSVNRAWRKAQGDPRRVDKELKGGLGESAQTVITPAPRKKTVIPQPLWTKQLHIFSNEDQLKYTLLCIRELGAAFATIRSRDDWEDQLTTICEWTGAMSLPQARSRTINRLRDEDYICPVYNDQRRLIGYDLTPKSIRLIEDVQLPTIPVAAPKTNHIATLLSSKNQLRELAAAAEYLGSIECRRQTLLNEIEEKKSQIEALDAEVTALEQFLSQGNIASILKQVGSLPSLPVREVRKNS